MQICCVVVTTPNYILWVNMTFVQLQFPLAQVSSDFPKKIISQFVVAFFFLLQGTTIRSQSRLASGHFFPGKVQRKEVRSSA